MNCFNCGVELRTASDDYHRSLCTTCSATIGHSGVGGVGGSGGVVIVTERPEPTPCKTCGWIRKEPDFGGYSLQRLIELAEWAEAQMHCDWCPDVAALKLIVAGLRDKG